jgi:hypothetical protein
MAGWKFGHEEGRFDDKENGRESMPELLPKRELAIKLHLMKRTLYAHFAGEEDRLHPSGVVGGVCGAFNDVQEHLFHLQEWYDATRPVMEDLAKHAPAIQKLLEQRSEE